MEQRGRRLKHRIDVPDIGRHDGHRWYLTLYVINWLGQTSHITPRPSTSRTESEVSNAGRSSTCMFTSLHRPQLPLNWSNLSSLRKLYSLLFHHSHVPLTCFSLFYFSLPLKLCPPSPPPLPSNLGRLWELLFSRRRPQTMGHVLQGGGGGVRRSLSEPGFFKDLDRWIRRQQSLRRNLEPVGVVPVHYGNTCALIAQAWHPVFF